MKNILSVLYIAMTFALLSCNSSKVSFEQVQAKVYSNDFTFVAIPFENKRSYSAPAGTGRIISSNTPSQTDGNVGVKVTHDRLLINLPSTDQEATINKYSVNTVSENFTVARKILDNGNILVNFFLKDQKNINIIKMEIDKVGHIDCSVEGPNLKPVLYDGYLKI